MIVSTLTDSGETIVNQIFIIRIMVMVKTIISAIQSCMSPSKIKRKSGTPYDP